MSAPRSSAARGAVLVVLYEDRTPAAEVLRAATRLAGCEYSMRARWLVPILMLFAVSCSSCGPSASETTSLASLPLWEQTKYSCVPEYPRSSLLAGRQGVGIVLIDFQADGTPDSIAVLQAPDKETASSVHKCASQWRILPMRGAGAKLRRGKLYFYFVSSNGRGDVFLANDPKQNRRLITNAALE